MNQPLNLEPAVGIEPTTARAQSFARSEREGVETGPEGDGSGESSPLNDQNATPKPDQKRTPIDESLERWRNIVGAEADLYRIENRYGNEREANGPDEVEHIHPNWACGGLQRKVQPTDEVLAAVLAEVARQERGEHLFNIYQATAYEYRVWKAALAIRDAMRLAPGGAA